MSSFSGLQVAVRGLLANQAALEVTSHNISNVNTPGYTRQEAVFQTGMPRDAAYYNGQVGTGVTIAEVRRVADNYLDNRLQNENAAASFWQDKADILRLVEGDIGSVDLPGQFNSFWASWHELSLDSEAANARFTVQQEAQGLVETLKTAYKQVEEISADTEKMMVDQVSLANSLSEQVARLNSQISISIKKGEQPNDLIDERVSLLKDLVGITGAAVDYEADDTVTVILDGESLVSGALSRKILVTCGSSPTVYQDDWEFLAKEEISSLNNGSAGVIWDGGSAVNIENGSLGGLMAVRDGEINSYLTRLNELAVSLVSEVNAVHTGGYNELGETGINFFKEPCTGVSDLALSEEVTENVNRIAADESASAGKGLAALDIYNLMTEKTDKFGQFLSGLLTEIGAATKAAETQETAHQDMMAAMENSRAAVSGVSLDEELTRMIQFQRAYQASARVLTMMDDMLDTLVNEIIR